VSDPKVLRIAIIAGEASGDILGGGLMRVLKRNLPENVTVQFEGIGGDLMLAEGLDLLEPMESLSVMGLVEVLGRLRSLLKLRKNLIQRWIDHPPDLFIGIDAPDFNLTVEQKLKAAGIQTVHYVSPSVWAWKSKRIFKIKESVDLLLTLFPFEERYYAETKQRIACVGHPLAHTVAHDDSLSDARDSLGLSKEDRVLAVLPGSRGSEIKYLLKPFLETASALKARYPELKIVLPAANPKRFDEIQSVLSSDFPSLEVQLELGQSRVVMAASDVILIASGTATLEATLLKKPMVVGYKMAWLTYAIYSRMLKTPFVSLPNILANAPLVPEVLQDELTVERLTQELSHWLDDAEARQALEQRFTQIFDDLYRDSDQLAAKAVLSLMAEKHPVFQV
jgi:lipid-A-disaccharide synthase